jgi:hypothetical protein
MNHPAEFQLLPRPRGHDEKKSIVGAASGNWGGFLIGLLADKQWK